MRIFLRVFVLATAAGLTGLVPAAESPSSSRLPLTLSKSTEHPSPPRPGAAPDDAEGGFERAMTILKESLAPSEGAEVFEGLPHPFEKEARAAEQQKPTRRFDEELFYASPAALTPKARRELETLVQSGTLVPFRGLKLCGGFHADYAVRWLRDKGARQVVVMFCFGCGEARIVAEDGQRWTTDLSPEGLKELRAFFAPFRQERPAPNFKTN